MTGKTATDLDKRIILREIVKLVRMEIEEMLQKKATNHTAGNLNVAL